MRVVASAVFFAMLSFVMMPTSSAADAESADKRGCCSHHHGVCSCKEHHTICCDGTTSPTCTCAVTE